MLGKQSRCVHFNDFIMSAMASQITGVSIVCTAVCSGAYQIKHKSSESLAFAPGIDRWSVYSPYKRPVTRKVFQYDDAIMSTQTLCFLRLLIRCTERCEYYLTSFLISNNLIWIKFSCTCIYDDVSLVLSQYISLLGKHLMKWQIVWLMCFLPSANSNIELQFSQDLNENLTAVDLFI